MTSYVKIGHGTTEIFISKGQAFKTEKPFYDSFAENALKTVKTGHFCQNTPKRRLFGPKITSYVKNRHGTTKIFSS